MHTLIMDNMHSSCNIVVDHINGNTLDNRKSNLRVVTQSKNMAHRLRPKRKGSSKYWGVYYVKKHKRWRASIKVNRKTRYLGHFKQEKDAARAYNEAALFHFGECATLNPV